MTNNKQRIEWIDMAKGYGIILVILGHCDIPLFTDYIYAFHIPLFFFLSGYVYTIKDSFVIFSYNKVRKMIIPYFCLCIPMIFFELYFGNKGLVGFDGILTEAYNFILQERHTTLWYLSTLILIVFIMYPLLKYKFRFLSIIIIISSFCGLLLWRYKIMALPWNIDAVLVVLPFFYVGYFVKNKYGILAFPQSYKRYSLLASLFFLTLSIVITYWNVTLSGNRIDIYCSTFGIEWISYISAFAGLFSCIFLSMFFTNSIIIYISPKKCRKYNCKQNHHQ